MLCQACRPVGPGLVPCFPLQQALGRRRQTEGHPVQVSRGDCHSMCLGHASAGASRSVGLYFCVLANPESTTSAASQPVPLHLCPASLTLCLLM